MQEEFEKKIQERMHTFGIQPSYQVWDDIDAVLSKRKHRRVFTGWWILLGLIAMGGGVLFYERDTIMNDKLNQQPAITKDTSANNMAKTAPANPALNEGEAAKTTSPKSNSSLKEANPQQQSSNEKSGKENITYQNTKKADKRVAQKLTAISKGNITATQNDVKALPANKTADITAKTDEKQPGDNVTAVTPPVEEPAAALQSGNKITADKQQEIPAEPAKKTPEATDILKQDNPATKVVKAKGARHQWLFTVAGGTTQTIANGSINGQDKSLSPSTAYYLQNITGLTSLAAYKYDLVKPGTGFNISAGGIYQYSLAKKWRVSAGLQIAYLSNMQKTGLLYNNYPASFNTGVSGAVFSPDPRIDAYYQAQSASINTEVNKAWQLQVPVSLSYVVNPKSKTKFILNGGVSVAWMVSSKWLIPDSRYGKLYYSKPSLNNTIVSWQAGPSLKLRNQLEFGLRYEESFTTFAKKYVTPNLYWQNISMYVAIPFKGKAKK